MADEQQIIQELIDKNEQQSKTEGKDVIENLVNSGEGDGGHQIPDEQAEETSEVKDEGAEETTNDDEGEGSSEESEEEGAEAADLDVSKYFEGYASLGDVKTSLERAKQFTPELEEELNTLRQSNREAQTLQQEVKQLKERQPFNNEKFYKLDKLYADEPDKAAILMRYSFGDNSAESVLKLEMMLEHPQIFEKNPESLQRQVTKKYHDFYSGEFTPEDLEYQDAKIAMEIDADRARKLFDAEIGKVEVPKRKTDEEKQAETEIFFKTWTPVFPKVKGALGKIDIPSIDAKDNSKTNVLMSYDIPKEDLKQVYEIAANHIATTRIQPDEEGIRQAVDVAKGVYLWNNLPKIVTKLANYLSKEVGQQALSKVNNPAKAGADVSKAPKGKKKDGREQALDEITAPYMR